MDVFTILLWACVGLVVLLTVLMFEENKKPRIDEPMPRLRQGMIVMTKRGLMVPKKRIELGGGKFHLYYDHPSNYNAVYNEDELIPADPHQVSNGSGRPVYIEKAKALEIAYGADKELKDLALAALKDLSRKAKDPQTPVSQAQDMLAEIKKLEGDIIKLPVVAEHVQDKLRQATNKALLYESELRSAEIGEDGRVARRAEQLADIAAKRAASRQPAGRSGEDN